MQRLAALKDRLIVSCQPVAGGPMDRAEFVVAFGLAALSGGAAGLRIEGFTRVAAMRAASRAPIIGLVKRDVAASPVRITPLAEDVADLARAGADVIALDATDRPRPVPVVALIAAVQARGLLAMADCATAREAEAALEAGADIVGTTLAGYTGGPEPQEPDLDLIAEMRGLTPMVIAEGRIRRPDQAQAALRRGAFAVVVGSAITRPEHVTGWFSAALREAGEPARCPE